MPRILLHPPSQKIYKFDGPQLALQEIKIQRQAFNGQCVLYSKAQGSYGYTVRPSQKKKKRNQIWGKKSSPGMIRTITDIYVGHWLEKRSNISGLSQNSQQKRMQLPATTETSMSTPLVPLLDHGARAGLTSSQKDNALRGCWSRLRAEHRSKLGEPLQPSPELLGSKVQGPDTTV